MAVDTEQLSVAKKYLSGQYRKLKTFKDNRRNMVELVEIDGIKYVVKSPRSEIRMLRMRLKTLIRPGEATSTYLNINRLRRNGFDALAQPFAAMVQRKYGMIKRSYILYEFVHGKRPEKSDLHMNNIVNKLHSLGIYHGDCRVGNFIVNDNNIKIIDTQANKMFFGNYRAHFDIFMLNEDDYGIHPYRKNVFFYLALFMRFYKRNIPGKIYKRIREHI